MTSVLIVLSCANYTALFIIAHYIQTEEEQMQVSSEMFEVRGSTLSTTLFFWILFLLLLHTIFENNPHIV